MTMEEYMESELSGIFRIKLVAKYIVLGSQGTQRGHVFAVWYLFLKTHANDMNQTVTLKCFLC